MASLFPVTGVVPTLLELCGTCKWLHLLASHLIQLGVSYGDQIHVNVVVVVVELKRAPTLVA